jgi:cytochrome c5
MKKTILIALAIVSITVACKSKKAASSTTSTDSSMDAQLTAVKARFPDATKEELQKGHAIYTGACTKCHGTKDVTVYTEPKLLEIVDVMAAKSNLIPAEKQALIRFAVGVRATSK